MAFIEISELQSTGNLDNNSVFAVVYQGQTKKITFNDLKQLIKFFESASYNKSTGVFTFGLSDGTSATLNTDLQLSVKDISLNSNILTIIKQDGTTETITLPQPDLSNYVEKEEGKGLSSNDYTTAEKNKLAGIDLANYVTNTDYASADTGGVIKANGIYAILISSGGALQCSNDSYSTYQNRGNNAFIGKGTLENVLNARIGDIATLLDEINGEII